MRINRFSINIILRVLLILFLSIVFGFLFSRTDYFFSQIIIGILISLLTFDLIFFNKKAVRDLNKFLYALRHDDMTVNFSDQSLGPAFKDLSDSFREIIQINHKLKSEKEAQYKLLQAIIDQIDFGIMALDRKGDFLLINKSSQLIFGLNTSSNWDMLARTHPDFVRETDYMSPDSRKLLEVSENQNILQLSVFKHTFKILDEECDLITFYDIRNEIDQKEIEAWFKLIRVLTHEIMNSVTPLSSLTDTILMLLANENGIPKSPEKINSQNISDIINAVNTIKNRSNWILKFVEDYRKLTNIPAPDIQSFQISKLLNSVKALMQSELSERGITLSVKHDDEAITIKADFSLMEMVLINLVSNSMYALDSRLNPNIIISTYIDGNVLVIEVRDNGKGIPRDRLDKIFIPFYSTREGGSGIGLSLSKQIAYLHHGRIKVYSEPDVGTRISILLNM